jgi:hypothetical protein
MRLRDIVLCCGIAGWPLLRAESTLAGDAALQLGANLFSAALLQRVGAPGGKNGAGDQERKLFHLLMIENKRADARGR